MLTRNEMESVIRSGGSVLIQGSVINRIADLPSELDLAAGDPEREASARAELEAEIERLKGQLAKAAPRKPAAKSATPTE